MEYKIKSYESPISSFTISAILDTKKSPFAKVVVKDGAVMSFMTCSDAIGGEMK